MLKFKLFLGHPELKINLSHAGNFTVLAAQSHQNINHTKDNQEPTFLGIDVMPLKDSRDHVHFIYLFIP